MVPTGQHTGCPVAFASRIFGQHGSPDRGLAFGFGAQTSPGLQHVGASFEPVQHAWPFGQQVCPQQVMVFEQHVRLLVGPQQDSPGLQHFPPTHGLQQAPFWQPWPRSQQKFPHFVVLGEHFERHLFFSQTSNFFVQHVSPQRNWVGLGQPMHGLFGVVPQR